jgi:DNA primase
MHEPFIRRASHVLDVPDIPLFEALTTIQRERRQKSSSKKRPAVASTDVYYAEEIDHLEPAYGDYAADTSEEEHVPASLPLPEEKMLIRLMLDHGRSMVEFVMGNMAMDEFTVGVVRDTIMGILTMYEEGNVDRNRLAEGAFGANVQRLVTEVLMQRHEPSENWVKKQIQVPRFNEHPREAAASTMTQLKLDRVKEELQRVQQRIFHSERQGKDLRTLLEEQMDLHALRKQIENQEFLDWNA